MEGVSRQETIVQYDRARACLRLMKEIGEKEKYKLGIVEYRVISGEVGSYRSGEVVLFREDAREPGDKRGPTITIERPMTLEEMMGNLKKGNHILTIGTMIGVPADSVVEIKSDA